MMPYLISSKTTVLNCSSYLCKMSMLFICMSVSSLFVFSFLNWARSSREAFALRVSSRFYFTNSIASDFLLLSAVPLIEVIMLAYASMRRLSTLGPDGGRLSLKCAVAFLTFS